MSTTNPGGLPGAGPQWPHDAASGPRPDDHAGGGGVNPAALKAGHEPDVFDVGPIMSVPLAVGATFVIAFVVATAVFAYFVFARAKDPLAHPAAAKANEAPVNEQLADFGRKGVADGTGGRTVDAPRPEPAQPMTNNGRAITQFALPVQAGSAPLVHPEDNRPDRHPGLSEVRGWVGKDHAFARVTVDDAIALAAGPKAAWLPVAQGAPAGRPDAGRFTAVASGGRGAALPGVADLIKLPEKKAPAKTEPPKGKADGGKAEPPKGKADTPAPPPVKPKAVTPTPPAKPKDMTPAPPVKDPATPPKT